MDDVQELKSRMRHALSFLKQEALGALEATWRPAWWSWVVVTVVFFLFLIYPTLHDSASMGDIARDVSFLLCVSGFVALYVAIPVGIFGLLWRLFGWGSVFTLVVAPPAFILTAGVFSPWLLDLGGELMRAVSASFDKHGGMALTRSLGVNSIPGTTGGDAPGGEAASILLAIFAIPIAVCLVIDVLRLSLDPALLLSAVLFLGAVGAVFILAIFVAILITVPALIFTFLSRTRERYGEFTSE